MNSPVNRHTAPHYKWGAVCDGYLLANMPDLCVIEELVPPGAGENWHVHRVARQFFYILEGAATLQMDGRDVPLGPGDGFEVWPGVPHRFRNSGLLPVRFLVISAPSTRGDRFEVAPSVN